MRASVPALAGLLLLTLACNPFARSTSPAAGVTPTVADLPGGTPVITTANGLTEPERLYNEAVKRQMDAVGASIIRFNELMRTPRTQQPEWRTALNREIDAWPAFAPQGRALTPPARYQRFHTWYVEALGHMAVAAQLMQEVQRTQRQEIVPEINSRIGEANTAFTEANRRNDVVPPQTRISVVTPASLVPRT